MGWARGRGAHSKHRIALEKVIIASAWWGSEASRLVCSALLCTPWDSDTHFYTSKLFSKAIRDIKGGDVHFLRTSNEHFVNPPALD